MRLRWWRPEPKPAEYRLAVESDHARDSRGRLIDGDTVRPAGTERWAYLLAHQPDGGAGAAARDALDGHTRLLPIITPAVRSRGWGRW